MCHGHLRSKISKNCQNRSKSCFLDDITKTAKIKQIIRQNEALDVGLKISFKVNQGQK